MNERHIIVLGTGNESFDELIKTDLEQHDIGQVVSKINTRNVLLKRVLETSATMVIVGDDLIGNDGGDAEWELIFEELRNISVQLRIIFICDRPEDDLFLAKLTLYSIYDIFNNGSLPADYIKQLSKSPEFKNIARFKKNAAQATEDMVRDQQEREAEKIIKTGIVPKEEQVIKATVPIYERLLIPPQLIVIASAYEGAGSSTLMRMFLEYLATLRLHVGLLESPFSKPSWFDFINADAVLNDSQKWQSWHKQLSLDQSISSGHDISIKDVIYIIRNKQEVYADWDLMKSAQLVGMARQIPILFYDLSSNIDDDRERIILKQANHILLVSSYEPVRVNREFKRYEAMARLIGREKITLICNRSTANLEKNYGKELTSSYQTDRAYFFPYLENALEVTMNGDSGWSELPEDKYESIEGFFSQLAGQLIGQEIIEKLKPTYREKKGAFFRKLFKR